MAFWATEICGSSYDPCLLTECGTLGLRLLREDNGGKLSSDNYLAGVIYNILAVDAQNVTRETSECINGSRGGYWADTFTRNQSGTNLRQILRSQSTIEAGRESQAALIASSIKASLEKLKNWGLAKEITVETEYRGNGLFAISIVADTTRLDLIRGEK